MDYVLEVKEFVIENFLFGEADGLMEDSSLLDSGIIDSTGILEVVAFIEEKYQFRIADEELVPENFATINDIARYISGRMGEN
jgi:acyl carrier protein